MSTKFASTFRSIPISRSVCRQPSWFICAQRSVNFSKRATGKPFQTMWMTFVSGKPARLLTWKVIKLMKLYMSRGSTAWRILTGYSWKKGLTISLHRGDSRTTDRLYVTNNKGTNSNKGTQFCVHFRINLYNFPTRWWNNKGIFITNNKGTQHIQIKRRFNILRINFWIKSINSIMNNKGYSNK